MEFFIHSSTGCFSKDLKNLLSDYGMAGLGFFWMALEKILLCNKPVPLTDLVQKGFKGFARYQAEDLIIKSGLFYYDENECVTLVKNVDYGIENKSLETYFSKLPLCTPLSSRVADRVGDRVGDCVGDRVGDRVDAGPCKLDKEKKREENIARKTLSIFMEEHCPHLLEMAEPLTLQQFCELKKSYSEEQVKDVLLDMENDIGLSKRRRSCFQTALAWLKKRHGEPQSCNIKTSKAVFCGLDEHGSPIYKQLNNNNNGKQDSNSAVCAADAE